MHLIILLAQLMALGAPCSRHLDALQGWMTRTASVESLFSEAPLTAWPTLTVEQEGRGWQTVARRVITMSCRYADKADTDNANVDDRLRKIIALRDAACSGNGYLNVLTGVAITRIGCSMMLKAAQRGPVGSSLDEELRLLTVHLPSIATLQDVVEGELGLVVSFGASDHDGSRRFGALMQAVVKHPREVKRVELSKVTTNPIEQALNSRSLSALLTTCSITDYQASVALPVILQCLTEGREINQDSVVRVIELESPAYPVGSWLHKPRPGDALSIPQFWKSVRNADLAQIAWANIGGGG